MPVTSHGFFIGGSKGPGAAVTHTAFEKHLTSGKVVVPDQVRFDNLVSSFPMLGNNAHGDCEVAGAFHLLQIQMALANVDLTTPTTAEALRAFYYLNKNTEDGLFGYQILNYWKNQGLNGIRIENWSNININWDRTAYTAVKDYADTKNKIKKAVWLFGGAMLEVLFPDGYDDQYVHNNKTWIVDRRQYFVPIGTGHPDYPNIPYQYNYNTPGGLSRYASVEETWIVPANISNGHCMTICGYDDDWVYLITWGVVAKMSWDYLFHYVTGVFAACPTNWYDLSKKRLSGYTNDNLKKFLATFKSPQFSDPEAVD